MTDHVTPLTNEIGDATPSNITLPRPKEEYREQAEFAEEGHLRHALGEALRETMLVPERYAELMWLFDAWLVEDRHVVRQDIVGRPERRSSQAAD